MDFITELRTVRAIERTSRKKGFHGDATLDPDTIRPLGTLREQLAMIEVGLDSGVKLHTMSSLDMAWTRERLRSAVLGGTSSQNSVEMTVSQNSLLPIGNKSSAKPSTRKERKW